MFQGGIVAETGLLSTGLVNGAAACKSGCCNIGSRNKLGSKEFDFACEKDFWDSIIRSATINIINRFIFRFPDLM